MRTLAAAAIVFLAIAGSATSKRLKDRIYKEVDTSGFCFRRTNGTHEIGCSSDLNGNVGVVHLIRDEPDLDWLVTKGPHVPYTAVFLPNSFSHDALIRLRESGKVSGVLLLNSPKQPRPAAYSDDTACPNALSSLYNGTSDQCDAAGRSAWNPAGSGTMFESFPFPIFMIKNETTTDDILDCFAKFNEPTSEGDARPWPLCAVELKSHMYSSSDTETCLRRGNIGNVLAPVLFCDAMGDNNVHYFVEERNATTMDDVEREKVILVTTQLDTFTLFDFNEKGADSPSTNIVALLETAALIAENKPEFKGGISNILFAFLNGEAFDYIGSSRMVYEMNNKSFPDWVGEGNYKNGHQPPLDLEHVDHMVTLGQLYNVESKGELFAHTDTEFSGSQIMSSLLSVFKRHDVDLKKSSNSKGLPPSSIQSFLKESRSLPAIHISDFDQKYTNQFYHGLFDTAKENLEYEFSKGERQALVQHISRVSAALADYLYTKAGGSANVRFAANETRVNEMLHCYLEKADCKLFNAAANANTPPFYGSFPNNTAYPQYVGVSKRYTYHGTFTRNLLALLTSGEPMEDIEKPEDCVAPKDQNVYEYIFLKSESAPALWTGDKKCNETSSCGFCFKTTTFRRQAVSPAFVIDDYDYSDGKYSAWAESVWKTAGARLFLKASPALQLGHFFFGLIIFVSSFFLSWWGTKKAPELFDSTGENGSSSGGSGTVATQDSVLVAGNQGGAEPTPL
jgi:nicastrin